MCPCLVAIWGVVIVFGVMSLVAYKKSDVTLPCGCGIQEEWEKEEVYFEQLEKKEVMEDKLKTLKELSVTVVQCKQVCALVCPGIEGWGQGERGWI